MRIIETTAHIGPDGMLRVEVPVDDRDKDVRVAVVVESMAGQFPARQGNLDKWAEFRARLEAHGLRVPPPWIDNPGEISPIALPGPSASEALISDRR